MTFPERYEQIIGVIVSACPAPDKFAHSYAGLTIWLASALMLRRAWGMALTITIAAEVANEIIDRLAHGSWMWPDTLGDAAALGSGPRCSP